MMDQIIRVAWDLNENTDNRYQLVYEIAELAKKLVDENQAKKAHDDFNFEENFDTTYKNGYVLASLQLFCLEFLQKLIFLYVHVR